ncbi:N-6 DNA methylase [Amycolatopsis sp. NPDC003731]
MSSADAKIDADAIWEAFRDAGVFDPFEAFEQFSYLILIRHLGEMGDAESSHPGFPRQLSWAYLTEQAAQDALVTISEDIFPWLRQLGHGEEGRLHPLEEARFTITEPSLLSRILRILGKLPVVGSNVLGRLYEYMLLRIVGTQGPIITPRHIVNLIVEMMNPGPADEICDPACGTAGFLVSAAAHIARGQSGAPDGVGGSGRLDDNHFQGFDVDPRVLRIAYVNLLLHGVETPQVRRRDALAQELGDHAGRYSIVMSDPPFGGWWNSGDLPDDLRQVVDSRNLELMFVARALQLLKPGGRAAVVVPENMLFSTSAAHRDLRRLLVENNRVDAVVKLPIGAFKPYAGVSTSVLFFGRGDGSGRTGQVWFYDATETGGERSAESFGDLLQRWRNRNGSERKRRGTDQSFCVARAVIAEHDYDLTLSRYRRDVQMKDALREGWRLGDIAEIFAGRAKPGDGDENLLIDESSTNRKVLHPSLFGVDLPEVAALPESSPSKKLVSLLREGDIVGRDLAAARHWTVVPARYDGVQAGQGTIVIRLKPGKVAAEYLAFYLSSAQAEKQFPRYDIIPRIRVRGLEDVVIPAYEGADEAILASITQLKVGLDEASRVQVKLQQSISSIFDGGSRRERRARLEQAADLSSLVAQTLSKQSEPYQLFQEAYAYPIARAVRRFRHSSSPAEKHEAAIQCAESLILSLGITALGVATQQAWLEDLGEAGNWFNAVRTGGVSLGHWIGVVRATGAYARKNGHEAAGLADATEARKGGRGLLADLGDLVTIRNKIRHGGGPRTRAEVERSLAELEELLLRCLASSAFLAKNTLVHMNNLQWVPGKGMFRISGLSLMGDHPDFRPTRFEVGRPLVDERIYLVTRQQDIVPLWPFCVLRDCPTCLAPELYYPDRLTGSTALLKSLNRGHELESDEMFDALGRRGVSPLDGAGVRQE